MSPVGAILSKERYRREVAGRNGMPSYRLLRRTVGVWSDVARWAGLRPHREWQAAVWGAARKYLVDLAYRLHEGNYGPSVDEWEIYRPDYLPDGPTLQRRLGNWAAVLGWAGGLEEAPDAFYLRAAALRERRRWQELRPKHASEAALAKLEARMLDEDRHKADLLTVSEPRVVKMYDWTTRRWRERAAASVR